MHSVLRRIAIYAACSLAGCLIVLGLATTAPARAQSLPAPVTVPAAPAAPCDGITRVPEAECRALHALYQSTGGAQWTQRGGWGSFLSPDAPCTWFGVTCSATRITGLALGSNHLEGTLPAEIGDLTALASLDLANNLIGDFAPRSLCRLAQAGAAADLSYNRLRAFSPAVAACLNQLDPGWAATQTVPPTQIRLTSLLTSSAVLAWQPISYTAATGGYEIATSQSISGPWTLRASGLPLLSSSAAITGLEPGAAYWLRMRTVTQAGGAQANTLASGFSMAPFVTASSERVMLALFFAGDNDLGPNIPILLQRLQRGTRANPNVDVFYLADGPGSADSVLWQVAGGTITSTLAVQEHFGQPEIDSGNPEALVWFLDYARTHAPGASREIVALVGHGVGLAPGLEFAESGLAGSASVQRSGTEVPPLPREKEATATDLTSGTYLSTAEYAEALAQATQNGQDPFDIVFFDQCFGGSVDALYEVRFAADIFVASPNYAWLAAPYDRYLAAFAPAQTPAEMATSILRIYEIALNQNYPNAIVAVSAAQIAALQTAASTLASALVDRIAAGETAPIAAAAMQSRYADTSQCGEQSFHLGPPDEMIGARRFAARLAEGFPTGPAHDAAVALRDLAAAIELRYSTGVPYVAPDEFWDYDDVLTLLAPLPRETPSRVAWRASVFRGDAPFAATYGPAPQLDVTVVDGFASARDGEWDEFLQAWYGAPLAPTVGQWCRYTPPILEISDDATIVTVTVAAWPDAGIAWPEVELAWPQVGGAISYRLYLERPQRGGWVLAATLPPQIAAYRFASLPPGAYRARLAAVDSDETVIAYSDPTPFAVDHRTLLPIVQQ